MVLRVRREEVCRDGWGRTDRQQVAVTREYRRKTNRQLVSFLHRSNKDGTSAGGSGEEVKIYKQ